jgi:oligopeptide transport system permease protein
MIGFILKRLVASFLVLFVVTSLAFLLVQLAPGSPFSGERNLAPSVEKQLKEKFGLGGSLWERYVRYLGSLAHGDLGPTIKYKNRSVNEVLAQSLPVSATLGSVAFLIATSAGLFLGCFAAVRRNSAADAGAMVIALFAISIPTFVIGPALILIFSIWLRILPVGGWNSIQSIILPAIVLATPFVAYIARLTRTSMIEVLSQDFVRTARSKGLPERRVVFQHALKVAILPVVSFLGPLAANLLTGSLVVERIFQIPGAGEFFINSILNRVPFLMAGVVLVYCTLLVLLNLLVDIAYTFLDRRIKLYE